LKCKKIYLVRHAETDYNKRGIVQGSGVDTDLNETGRKQASAFFNAYKQIPFDKIYCSGLKRSRQSVEAFETVGHQIISKNGLNEINWGNREGQVITTNENAYYLSMLDRWNKGGIEEKIEDGESPLDVQMRIKPVLNEILEDHASDIVLICMHGRAMRILLCTLLKYPLHLMDLFIHQNMGLYEITFTGTFARVDQFNNTQHLRSIQ